MILYFNYNFLFPLGHVSIGRYYAFKQRELTLITKLYRILLLLVAGKEWKF